MTNRKKDTGIDQIPVVPEDGEIVKKSNYPAIDDPKGREIHLRLGQIVLYKHRKMSSNPNVPDFFYLPMIITRIHDGDGIDGMVISDSRSAVGFEGMKPVRNVLEGEDEGQWEHQL